MTRTTTEATTKPTTRPTVEPTFENTLQHYSYAPLVELALKLAGRVKASRDRRAGVALPQFFDSVEQNFAARPEQARQAKPVSSPGMD